MNRQPHPAFATSQESLRNKPGEIVWNQRAVTRACSDSGVYSLGSNWSSSWLAAHALKSFRLLVQVSSFGTVFLDENYSVLARLGTDTDPVIDPLTLENGTGIYFFAHWVVMTEFFKDSAVSWIALINGAQTIERAIFAAQSLHSNSYRHCSFSPSKLENGRGDDSSATQSTRVVFKENNSNLLPLESSVAYEKPQILGKKFRCPEESGCLYRKSSRQLRKAGSAPHKGI